MPLQQLASLTVACSGLHAEDTAGLAHARQLTALDLSCNPCLSEACLQRLHGGARCLRPLQSHACKDLRHNFGNSSAGLSGRRRWKLHSQQQDVTSAFQRMAATQPTIP